MAYLGKVHKSKKYISVCIHICNTYIHIHTKRQRQREVKISKYTAAHSEYAERFKMWQKIRCPILFSTTVFPKDYFWILKNGKSLIV